jgi:uncharacterized RDD family membrane protein YckC
MSALADASVEGLQLAGRGERLGAAVLDSVLVMVPVLLAFVPMFMARDNGNAEVWSGFLVLLVVVAAIAVNCVLLSRNGQTIAKYMLRIRVARPDGSNPGLARIFFARYLPLAVLGALPFIGTVVTLVDALMIFRDNRRCLHDDIADTIVLKI